MRRGRFGGLRFQRRIRVLPGVHLNVSLAENPRPIQPRQ
jgi:hypothetical protein